MSWLDELNAAGEEGEEEDDDDGSWDETKEEVEEEEEEAGPRSHPMGTPDSPLLPPYLY